MAVVLIIDDDELVRLTVAAALETDGHVAIEAVDGNDALIKLKGAAIDIIVTDILMPNKEGIETISDIRSVDQHIPIIAMSGGGRQNNMNYLDIAKTLGADATLKKPFGIDEIRNAVTTLLARTA